jgi:hypothetical protein
VGTLRTAAEEEVGGGGIEEGEDNDDDDDENVDDARGVGKGKGKGGGDGDNNKRRRSSRRRKECSYVGDFVDGAFHGHGTLTNLDGSSYVGSFREGRRVTGIETLANGDVFEGSFANDDAREGRGVLLRTNNIGGGTGEMTTMTICGVWEGGMLKNGVDVCITYAEDGRCYFGDHADSIPHGELRCIIFAHTIRPPPPPSVRTRSLPPRSF